MRVCRGKESNNQSFSPALLQGSILEYSIPLRPFESLTVLQVTLLDPATHAYSFWEGVPLPAKLAFGKLFAASATLQVGSSAGTVGSGKCRETIAPGNQ